MYIAAAKLNLHLPASGSLKDKRRVLRSLVERTRGRFNAAVAEVDGQDTWQVSAIGVSVVSSSRTHAERSLEAVVRFVESFSPEAIVTGVDSDSMRFEE